MSAQDLQTRLDRLDAALRRFGRVRRFWIALEGAGAFVAGALGALLLWFSLDWLFRLPAWPLFLLFVLAAGVGVMALVRHLVLPNLSRSTVDGEAIRAETLHGKADNLFIGALQLARETISLQKAGASLGYSVALVEGLLEQAAERLGELDPRKLLDRKGAYRALVQGVAVLAMAGGIALFHGDAVRERITRLANAWDVVLETLFPVEMQVAPGDTAVVRGTPLELKVKVLGARRNEATLVRINMETEQIEQSSVTLAGGEGVVRLEPEDSFRYRFEYGGKPSETFRVLVDDRPRIQAISYELVYPSYTGQPPRALSGRVPKLEGLSGTNVLVSFAATTELHGELTRVEWQGSAPQPIAVNGRFGHFSFTLDRADRATVHLVGRYGPGFEMETPLSFEVAVRPDAAPSIRFLQKKRELVLLAEEAAAFGVRVLAEDDFGVAEMALKYKIDTVDAMLGRAPREGEIPRRITPARDRVKDQFLAIFEALDPPLAPGDRIRLSLTAKDNNTETGPGLGRSGTIEIVVVRPDLAAFREQSVGFGSAGARMVLQGLKKMKRATNLLVEPEKTVRTEAPQEVTRQEVKARVSQETWPSGAEDAVGDYFRVLSGGM